MLLTHKKGMSLALLNEATHGITLLAILIDQYGMEALDWHPTTRRMELYDDFGIELPVINGDKMNAAVDILTSDGFFSSVPKFVQYCNVLSGSSLSYGEFDPADAMECAWGITEALLIAMPDAEEPFSEEIRYYIGKVLYDEGIKTPPDVLKIGLWDAPADYSDMSIDEPAMFAAEFQVQEDESKEISELLRRELTNLLHELQLVPFVNGKAKNLIKQLGQGLVSRFASPRAYRRGELR